MNTSIMNANEKSVNWDVDMSIARKLLWRMGLDMYMEGRPLSDCLTNDERKGWWAGLGFESECNTPQNVRES